jgi:hypothetical protein
VPGSLVEPTLAEQPSAALPRLARALIPSEALDEPTSDELTVEECGIQPVFPCVSTYFVTENLDLQQRRVLLRRQARTAGWRILSERREGAITIDLARAGYRARYMLEADDPLLCESASRCVTGTDLTVAGRPTPLPAPSADERDSWSAEKKAFVAAANAVCVDMQAGSDPAVLVAVLREGLAKLSALRAPTGEEREVDRILRALQNLVRALDALTDDESEDALPAAVAAMEFTKRFNEAASRFGLDACARAS